MVRLVEVATGQGRAPHQTHKAGSGRATSTSSTDLHQPLPSSLRSLHDRRADQVPHSVHEPFVVTHLLHAQQVLELNHVWLDRSPMRQ